MPTALEQPAVISVARSTRALPARHALWLGVCLVAGLTACKAQPPAGEPSATPADSAAAAPATTAAATPTAAAPVALSAEQLQAVVDGMLRKAYGEKAFNAGTGCWSHSFEGANDTLDYCMKPDTPKVVAAASGTQVYFQTYSDPNADTYSLVDPGLRGAFAATVTADGKWTPLAATAAIDQGQAGDCGCRDAQLVQVGPDRHGWLGTAGGTWQGVSVTQYTLLVPVNGTFRDVSRIAQSTEDSPSEVVKIQIDPTGTPVDGFYPIKATRQGDGAAAATSVIAFDPKQQVYPGAP